MNIAKILKTLSLFMVFLFAPLKLAAESGNSAGFVVVSKGEVVAVDQTGVVRSLNRQSRIYSDDTIKTGSNSSVQLRFNDMAIMKLKENSELVISEYHYGGEADTENTSIFNLISGGFRTISGSIGKANWSAYRVDTPAASIGIRGTDYEVIVTEAKDIHAVVWSGGITLQNEFGTVDIGIGSDFKYATVSSNQNLPPVGQKTVPDSIFVQEELPPLSEEDGADESEEQSEEIDSGNSPEGHNTVNRFDPTNYASPEEFSLLVLPNGVVVELPSEKVIGILDFETNDIYLLSELVFDPSGSVIHGPSNKVIGYIQNDEFVPLVTNPDILGGVILDKDGNVVGFIGENGELILLSNDPNDSGGVVLTPDGEIAGFIDENGTFTPNEPAPVGSFAFLLGDISSNNQAFGFVARFQNGDTVFVYQDEQGVEQYIPFTVDIGAFPVANHPSIEWGKWSAESVLLAQQSGHLAPTPLGQPDPEVYWIDVIPYDPSSLQARTGTATFTLTQMVAGGGSVDGLGLYEKLSLTSSSGSMNVDFSNNTLNGNLNFTMEGLTITNSHDINVNFNGSLYSPQINVSSAFVTDFLGSTNPINAGVAGVVTDTANAFGGVVSVTNEGMGQATTIGAQGAFIMEE